MEDQQPLRGGTRASAAAVCEPPRTHSSAPQSGYSQQVGIPSEGTAGQLQAATTVTQAQPAPVPIKVMGDLVAATADSAPPPLAWPSSLVMMTWPTCAAARVQEGEDTRVISGIEAGDRWLRWASGRGARQAG